jgi:hypothetical protein
MHHKETEPMSNADRQAKYRAKRKADGLVKVVIWAKPELALKIQKYVKSLEKLGP